MGDNKIDSSTKDVHEYLQMEELWCATVEAGPALGDRVLEKKEFLRAWWPALSWKTAVGRGFVSHFAAGVVVCRCHQAHC